MYILMSNEQDRDESREEKNPWDINEFSVEVKVNFIVNSAICKGQTEDPLLQLYFSEGF